MSDFIISVWKGTYPYFFVPALLVMLYRIWKRQWTKGETILLVIFCVSFLLQILQSLRGLQELFISRRYLMPFAPLTLGWVAWGLVEIYRNIPGKLRTVALLVAGAGIMFSVWDGLRPTLKTYTNKKKSVERKVSEIASAWIRNDYNGKKYDPVQQQAHRYVSARKPRVISFYPACGYWSGGSSLEPGNDDAHGDYAVFEATRTAPPGMRAVSRFPVEKKEFIIYKAVR